MNSPRIHGAFEYWRRSLQGWCLWIAPREGRRSWKRLEKSFDSRGGCTWMLRFWLKGRGESADDVHDSHWEVLEVEWLWTWLEMVLYWSLWGGTRFATEYVVWQTIWRRASRWISTLGCAISGNELMKNTQTRYEIRMWIAWEIHSEAETESKPYVCGEAEMKSKRCWEKLKRAGEKIKQPPKPDSGNRAYTRTGVSHDQRQGNASRIWRTNTLPPMPFRAA